LIDLFPEECAPIHKNLPHYAAPFSKERKECPQERGTLETREIFKKMLFFLAFFIIEFYFIILLKVNLTNPKRKEF
jgi:hypothetical protein